MSADSTTQDRMAVNLYDALDHTERFFRLLTLRPSCKPADTLECVLTTYRLDQHPEYEALSYCWGAGPHDRLIRCNGYPCKVTESLDCALRKLRFTEKPRLLWVDAICINQQDNPERTYQVKLMQDIYQQAARVVVWLGLSYESSDLAFLACERFALVGKKRVVLEARQELLAYDASIHILKNRREMFLDKVVEIEARERENCHDYNHLNATSDVETEVNCKEEELQPATGEEILAIYRLLARPYWRRCWVIQEFCLGKETLIVCGNKTIDSEALLSGIAVGIILTPDGKYGKPGVFLLTGGAVPLMTARREFQQNQTRLDIQELCTKFGHTLATDPRDKIYALLGVLSDESRAKLAIEPKYEISTAECYTRAAAAVLNAQGNLDILAVVRRDAAHSKMHLPSWVPDWGGWGQSKGMQIPPGSLRPTDEPNPVLVPKMRPFTALRCPTYHVILKDPNTLVLSGLFTDKLATVADTLRVPDEGSNPDGAKDLTIVQSVQIFKTLFYGVGQYFETLVEWENLALDGKTYPTGEDPLRVFAATLGASQMPQGEEEMFVGFQAFRSLLHGPKKLAHMKAFGLHKLRSLYAPAMALAGIVSARMNNRLQQDMTFIGTTDVTVGRRLARTEKGFIALVPELSQPGDCIALLRGGKLPFVMRPQKPRWEMIGCAYVHGIMFGEAWDENACLDIEVI